MKKNVSSGPHSRPGILEVPPVSSCPLARGLSSGSGRPQPPAAGWVPGVTMYLVALRIEVSWPLWGRATLGQAPSSHEKASWASERGWVQGSLTFQHLLKFLKQGLWGDFHTMGTRGTRRARGSRGSRGPWETREASLEEVKVHKSK